MPASSQRARRADARGLAGAGAADDAGRQVERAPSPIPARSAFATRRSARMWYEIGESVHRAGCRKHRLLQLATAASRRSWTSSCRELRVKLGMFAVGCSWFRTIDRDDLFERPELQHGIHGGEIETSVMLHLHRRSCRHGARRELRAALGRIERDGGMLTPEGAVGFGWQTQDLQPCRRLRQRRRRRRRARPRSWSSAPPQR